MGLARRVMHLVTQAHARVYRWTGGRVLGRLGHLEQVLLTTTGRRTGAPRTVPLAVTPVGSSVVLVASDGGAPGHPCLLYTSPSPRDGLLSRMPSSA